MLTVGALVAYQIGHAQDGAVVAATMLLTTLHWPDEVRATDELNLPEEQIEIKPAERKMAEQLVASMGGEFDPAQEHDEYREALMKVIEAKVAGGKADDQAVAKEAKPARAKRAASKKAKASEEEAPAARRRKTA